MVSFLKDMLTGFLEKKSLHVKLLSVIMLVAVIAIQMFILRNLANILRFAFYYEYSNGYCSEIDPISTIRNEPEWITSVNFFFLGILFEFILAIDREKIYRFSELLLINKPTGISGNIFSISVAYLALYILGALLTFFSGASFFFSTYHTWEAVGLYLLLSVYFVVPIVLLLASVIYIIVYLKKQRKIMNTLGEPLEAELWED